MLNVENRTKFTMHQCVFIDFYFEVLHPVARTLPRLLEEPSLATNLQGVYFIRILPKYIPAIVTDNLYFFISILSVHYMF
jgi:hypothetical protein